MLQTLDSELVSLGLLQQLFVRPLQVLNIPIVLVLGATLICQQRL